MTNPKESGARTKVGPHNTINVAIEDLPEAGRRALKKELKEEEARVFTNNTHLGDIYIYHVFFYSRPRRRNKKKKRVSGAQSHGTPLESSASCRHFSTRATTDRAP
jgi:hypothetical protein